ncbi:O-antigen ligase family protein [Salipiger abyssi]|uniref:O-antigen ligase family protein n=1 Tax=Salipiger abyssi TaxID=1250539 RepID=UPI0009F90C4A|nr:O-antigen ligase family protein [Salipiger abyssi]
MADTKLSAPAAHQIPAVTLAPLFSLAPAVATFSPKAMAPIFLVCAALFIGSAVFQRDFSPNLRELAVALLATLLAYGFLSATWSLAPDESIEKAIKLTLSLSVATLSIQASKLMREQDIERIGKFIKIGLLAGCALYISEFYFDHPVYNFFHPETASVDDAIKKTKPAAILTFWFIMAAPFIDKREWIVAALLVWFVVWTSDNRSVQLFYYLTLLATLVIHSLPARLLIRLFFIGSISVIIIYPAFSLKSNDLYAWKDTNTLPTAVFSRLEIWEQSANRAMEKPLLGWGLDTSPHIPNRGEMSGLSENYSGYEGQDIKVASLHPHNAPTQIWFELGAVGIGLVCLIILSIMRFTLGLRSARGKKILLLSFFFGFSYTLTLWGIWQSWFIATLCTLSLATAIAIHRTSLEGAPYESMSRRKKNQ